MGALPSVIMAQVATGSIKGALLNSGGAPAVNTKVSSQYYVSGKAVQATAYTDSTGGFSFSAIPIGVRVSVVVYDSQMHVVGKGSAVVASSGSTVTVTIQAVPAATQGGH